MIEKIPHECYAEPFVGMGGVFLRRKKRPKVEIINDISQDVSNLFRILQRHYQSFVQELRFSLAGRTEFQRLLSADPLTLTDLERAARFLYLQRLAFGGKVKGRTFGMATTAPSRFNLTKLEPMLADIHERLSGVVIERLDWSKLIKTYDRAHTLFYLDPPYFNCEADYGEGVFAKADFQRMAEQLYGIKGMFILSLNDTPEVRVIFKRFNLSAVDVTYRVGGGPTAAKELIIMNDRVAEYLS